MSSVARLLPFTVVAAAFLAACSDVSAPTGASPVPASRASKGSGSGGGGGGGGESVTQLVVTTPPTVNVTGRWMGTSDGPDIMHTYTYTLQQTSDGMVSGTGSTSTPFMYSAYSVVGTVNADTLMLYVGTLCSGCSVTPSYRGIVSADTSRIDGRFLNGGVSPVTLFRQ